MIYKIGEVVQLRSGSPNMTIYNIEKEGKFFKTPCFLSCQWFDYENNKIRWSVFDSKCVKLIDERL